MNQTTTPYRPRHLLLAGLVALAAALAGLSSVPAGAQAAPGDVLDVRPLPGQVVGVDDVVLRALVATDQDPSDVTVSVDGREVNASTRSVPDGVRVTAQLDGLVVGARQLAVRATVPDGTIERRWSVTASDRTVRRLAGADRFTTAVAVSQDQYPQAGSADAAVLARADDFADALAGAPLAAHVGGPLLLTDPAALPAATDDELNRVLADGATVHVLGGEVAVSANVVRALEADGHRVVRHAGPTRFATAVAVAEQLPNADTFVLASAPRFPDALAASVPAARAGWPILLTEQDQLPAATRDGVDMLGAGRAVVVGGPVAIGSSVLDQVRPRVDDVDRIAGENREATAAAIAAQFLPGADEVALASGRDYPDALAAAPRAAEVGAPLLLAARDQLPVDTDGALRSLRPSSLVVHGGPVALSADVATAAYHAIVDGPGVPRVQSVDPAPGTTSTTLAPIEVAFDRALRAGSVVASVNLDGTELPTTARLSEDGTRVVVDPLSPGDLPMDQPREVHVVLRVTDTDARTAHHAHSFTLREDRVFATAAGIELVEPSRAVEVIGYHQSNHEGAQQMTPTAASPEWHTMASRGRRTASRTSADVVADEQVRVTSPVTGTVVRAGRYVLYCDDTDNYVAIEPDGHPGIEVKMLHFRGLHVGSGDRVVAGETVIGDGPRRLPFSSQVDDYSDSGHGPHVHVEVVDTSIPNISNGGSGSEDC